MACTISAYFDRAATTKPRDRARRAMLNLIFLRYTGTRGLVRRGRRRSTSSRCRRLGRTS
eukprot:7390418-Prymnesium_polylepis.1